MLIKKQAVEAFLNRKLRSFEPVKKMPDYELDRRIAKRANGFEFYTQPRRHQKECFYIGSRMASWLFFASVGSGKTKIALDLIAYHKLHGRLQRTLVVVPNDASIETWLQQVEEHRPDLKAIAVNGSTEERRKILEFDEADIYVIHYPALVFVGTQPESETSNKRVLDEEYLDRIGQYFDCLVMDESHRLKSWRSLTFHCINILSRHCAFRYGLTGTPHGRDPHDLWAQFAVVDHGETLGRTLSIFRAAYFNSKKNYWGGYEHKFQKRKEKHLHRTIQNRSIYYSPEEYVDLPDVVRNRIYVTFPIENHRFYEEDRKLLHQKDKSYREIENVFLRLRQISSGFLSLKDDETGDRELVEFPQNPKLEATASLVEDIVQDAKVIVFNEFIKSGDLLCEELKKKKIEFARLYSGTKDVGGELRKFQQSDKCRVMVANHASGGTGLNLQVASYVVFYESPVSPIGRTQAEGRIIRQGQQAKRVFIYDMLMKNSMDETILSFIEQGKDLFRAIVEGKVEA